MLNINVVMTVLQWREEVYTVDETRWSRCLRKTWMSRVWKFLACLKMRQKFGTDGDGQSGRKGGGQLVSASYLEIYYTETLQSWVQYKMLLTHTHIQELTSNTAQRNTIKTSTRKLSIKMWWYLQDVSSRSLNDVCRRECINDIVYTRWTIMFMPVKSSFNGNKRICCTVVSSHTWTLSVVWNRSSWSLSGSRTFSLYVIRQSHGVCLLTFSTMTQVSTLWWLMMCHVWCHIHRHQWVVSDGHRVASHWLCTITSF